MKKTCKMCNTELEMNEDNFFKRKDSKDGYRNECKDCKAKKEKSSYEKNREKRLTYVKNYTEENKEQIKIQRKQYREENKEEIKSRRNKEQDKESCRNYWLKNRDKLIGDAKKWKKENKDRVKAYKVSVKERERELERKRYRTIEGRIKAQMKRNSYISKKNSLLNNLTLEEWESCLVHFNNECAYCGSSNGTIEQEHFVPVTKDGEFTKDNIVTACRTCNASKSNRDFEIWYSNQPFYSYERERKILEYLGVGKIEFSHSI